ncbi:MAG: 4-phosphoerythronate dehydrogenase PdxB [Bacteroidota bacterium]
MKIIIDNKIPFINGVLEPFAELEYYPGKDINAEKVKDADALIVRTRTKCNKKLLEESSVKLIATATIGFDHIDTAYCNTKGIKWENAPGCNSGSVMQYIASSLVFLSIKHNFNLKDKTLGIIGVGNVGSKVAAIAAELGMRVLLNDPPRERNEGSKEFVPLKQIQEQADIITFHVPLNFDGEDKTYHIFDEKFISKIKHDAIIINSSRGEVVSGEILKKALLDKKIKGAILDVWENEPGIDLELMSLVDIATPHIAGYSADGKASGTSMSVQALSKFFGLGLDNWLPGNIPEPTGKNISMDGLGLSKEEIVKKILYSTYNIKNDDLTLRKSPETFEDQRGNYPLRREYEAYSLSLENVLEDIVERLIKLGFEIG